jgi:hypothetical protein
MTANQTKTQESRMEDSQRKIPSAAEITVPHADGSPLSPDEILKRALMARERDQAMKARVMEIAERGGLITDHYEHANINGEHAKTIRERYKGLDEKAVGNLRIMTPELVDEFSHGKLFKAKAERDQEHAKAGRTAGHFQHEAATFALGRRDGLEADLFKHRKQRGLLPEAPDASTVIAKASGTLQNNVFDNICEHLEMMAASEHLADRINPELRNALKDAKQAAELFSLTSGAYGRARERAASSPGSAVPVFEQKNVSEMTVAEKAERFDAFERHGKIIEREPMDADRPFSEMNPSERSSNLSKIATTGGDERRFPHQEKRSSEMTKAEMAERLESLAKLNGRLPPPQRKDPSSLGVRETAAIARADRGIESVRALNRESIPEQERSKGRERAVSRVSESSAALKEKLAPINDRLRSQRQQAELAVGRDR